MELLHLPWAWNNHVLSWFLLGLVVMMVVMVMYVTEVRVYETVGLNLCCWLEMEMLIWIVHLFKLTSMTRCFRSMIMMLSTLWLRILLGLFLFLPRFSRFGHLLYEWCKIGWRSVHLGRVGCLLWLGFNNNYSFFFFLLLFFGLFGCLDLHLFHPFEFFFFLDSLLFFNFLHLSFRYFLGFLRNYIFRVDILQLGNFL